MSTHDSLLVPLLRSPSLLREASDDELLCVGFFDLGPSRIQVREVFNTVIGGTCEVSQGVHWISSNYFPVTSKGLRIGFFQKNYPQFVLVRFGEGQFIFAISLDHWEVLIHNDPLPNSIDVEPHSMDSVLIALHVLKESLNQTWVLSQRRKGTQEITVSERALFDVVGRDSPEQLVVALSEDLVCSGPLDVVPSSVVVGGDCRFDQGLLVGWEFLVFVTNVVGLTVLPQLGVIIIVECRVNNVLDLDVVMIVLCLTQIHLNL